MSFWLADPELFLYAKGTGPDDVHLWRCRKPASSSSSSSSSLVVPMKPDDFEYVETVTDHLELIGDLFDWDVTDYKRLVKYIYEKRLLVNGQGFVIAGLLHNADKDGNKTIDDANEEVPTIYIRSLDVLALKTFIPELRERPIPLRTVQVLEDVNGKAALMEGDSQVTKLTAKVENLEAGGIRLEYKNNILATSVTKLTAATTGNVADLQSKNKALEAENKTLDSNVKTLEGKVTKLTADLVTQMNALKTLQQEVKNIHDNPNIIKEAWMNDLTNNEWVGVGELLSVGQYDNVIIIGQRGTFTVDDLSTNVRASYWCNIKLHAVGDNEYKAVSFEDLTPNYKERARFSQNIWCFFKSKGKTYVFRDL